MEGRYTAAFIDNTNITFWTIEQVVMSHNLEKQKTDIQPKKQSQGGGFEEEFIRACSKIQ